MGKSTIFTTGLVGLIGEAKRAALVSVVKAKTP
jgi:hypothetical protein